MASKLKFISLLIVLIMIGISCNKEDKELEVNEIPVFNLEEPDFIEDENYEIYSTAIESLTKKDTVLVEQLSYDLTDTIGSNYDFKKVRLELPQIENELLQSLENNNQSSLFFDDKFQSDQKEIKLISSEEKKYIYSQGFDEPINKYENYSSIFRFTKIAFNEDKTKAVLESSTSGSGAQGNFIYLEKIENNWKVKKVIMLWLV